MILGMNLSRLIFGTDSESTKTSSQEFSSTEITKISQGLEKVASLPHNPDTYPYLMGMLKVASKCINSMSTELSQVKESVNQLEKKAEVRAIIEDMVNHGMTDEFDVEEKVAKLLSKDVQQINTIKEAIKLSASIRHGNLFDDFEKGTASSKQGMFDGLL